MHQTSTKYCVAVAHLTLMPINLLDHVIARRHVHDDLNVADSLERLAPEHGWVSVPTRRPGRAGSARWLPAVARLW
jgi:hypothetical protein